MCGIKAFGNRSLTNPSSGLISGNKVVSNATTSTAVTSTADYDVYANYDLPGYDMAWIPNIDSVDTCAWRCSGTTGCKAFTYVTNNFPYSHLHRNCIIKAFGNRSTAVPSAGLISGNN